MNKLEINPGVLRLKESSTLAINQRAKALRKEGKKIYHWGFGQSPFPVHQSMVDALIKNASNKDYLPTQGLPELRSEIAQFYLRNLDVKVSPDQVYISPGSKESLFQALFMLDGTVILPAPSWVSYKPQVDLKRSSYHIIQTKLSAGFKLTPELLEKAANETGKGQKILVFNNPNNPTGQLYYPHEVKSLAEVCRKHNIIVIADEIYFLINYGKENFESMASYYPERTIITGGISKAQSAGGYRLGYLILPDEMNELDRYLRAFISETYSAVSAPIQHAAIEGFADQSIIIDYMQKCTRIHKVMGQYFYERFQKMNVECSLPEGAFYLFVSFEKFREKIKKIGIKSGLEWTLHLLKTINVAMLPGHDFYRPENEFSARVATVDYDGKELLQKAEKYHELTFEFVEKEAPQIKEGLDQLEEYLNSLK